MSPLWSAVLLLALCCTACWSAASDDPLILSPSLRPVVQEGSSVSLPCDVRNKGSYAVAWFSMGPGSSVKTLVSLNKLAMIPDNRLSTTDRELTIHNVTFNDAGEWTCQLSTTPAIQVVHTLTVVPAGNPHQVPAWNQKRPGSGGGQGGTSSILNRNGRRAIPLLDQVLIRVTTPTRSEREGQPAMPTAGWSMQAPPQKTQRTGTVVAVGSGGRNQNGQTIPMAVREGDDVLLPEGAGIATVIENQEYVIVREADILAKWSD